MATMRALLLFKYGKPAEALAVTTVPKPVLDENSSNVLVRVKAASINPIDWKLAAGYVKRFIAYKFPVGVGLDVSGVVEEAGALAEFKPGDEVFGVAAVNPRGSPSGSIAQYAIAPSSTIALKPRTLSHEESSTLGQAGTTAFQALSVHRGARDVAFVPAGLGGVGSLALQLAKHHFGFARTITTVSTSKVALLKEHIPDVDVVIDYRKVDTAAVIPRGSVDFVLDPFGTPLAFTKFLCREPEKKPTVVSLGGNRRPETLERASGLRLSIVARTIVNVMRWWTTLWIPGHVRFESIMAAPNSEELGVLAELADKGLLKPIVGKVFPLEQAVEAFTVAEAGRINGKVVIRMD